MIKTHTFLIVRNLMENVWTSVLFPLLSDSETWKHLAIFCGCLVRFVSDLVGNTKYRFSHDAAHVGSRLHICLEELD